MFDCSVMIAAMLPEGFELAQLSRYDDALRMAQSDIDGMHLIYLDYYLREPPERHEQLVDVRRFGPGE